MNDNMKEKLNSLVNKFTVDLRDLIVNSSIQDVVGGFGSVLAEVSSAKTPRAKKDDGTGEPKAHKPRGMAALSPEERKIVVAKAQATRAANKKAKAAAVAAAPVDK